MRTLSPSSTYPPDGNTSHVNPALRCNSACYSAVTALRCNSPTLQQRSNRSLLRQQNPSRPTKNSSVSVLQGFGFDIYIRRATCAGAATGTAAPMGKGSFSTKERPESALPSEVRVMIDADDRVLNLIHDKQKGSENGWVQNKTHLLNRPRLKLCYRQPVAKARRVKHCQVSSHTSTSSKSENHPSIARKPNTTCTATAVTSSWCARPSAIALPVAAFHTLWGKQSEASAASRALVLERLAALAAFGIQSQACDYCMQSMAAAAAALAAVPDCFVSAAAHYNSSIRSRCQ